VTSEMATAREILTEVLDGIERVVRGCAEEDLRYHPTENATNSVAALVRHCCGSLDSWLARAVGEIFERDQDAEFRYEGDRLSLLAQIDAARSRAMGRVGALTGRDLSEILVVRRHSQERDIAVSRSWCLWHAIAHLAEHLGHMALTAQIARARRG